MRRSARQIALTMNSGVKCAYWVTRARLASSPGGTSCSRSSPRVSQPFGKASSADRRKRLLARSLAPNDMKEGEALLLVRSGVPRLLLDLAHQPDGGDVVRRARLPVGGEAAGAGEAEVARRNDDWRGGVFLGLGDRVVGRLAEGEGGIEAHRGGQGGRVEERQAQLVGGRLHCRHGPFGRARSTGDAAKAPPGSGSRGLKGGAAAAQAARSVRRLRPRSEAARAAHRPRCRDRRRRGHAPDGGTGSTRRSDWRRPRRERSRACRP